MDRDIEEALCDLQAQVCAQRMALRAIARTHPDPDALVKAWREALAEPPGSTPVPADGRRSEYLAETTAGFVEDWTAELVELVIPK